MDTFSRHQSYIPVEDVTPEVVLTTAVAADQPKRARTCGHCQYDGPLHVRRTYPLFLRGYMIAIGFALGIVPGILLLSWRRHTPSTLALTCPMCLFLRLEPESASKS